MKWRFAPEQLEFRDAVREMLGKLCEPATLRVAAEGPLPREAWDALAQMGVLTLRGPESHGGLGLDEISLVLLLEEAGYFGVPHPVVETAAVAVPVAGDRLTPDAMVTTDLGGPLVPRAADADFVLLRRQNGFELVRAEDADLEPVATVDPARAAARVTGRGDFIEADVPLAFDRGAWGTSAYLLGLARRMLDQAVAHVRDREQFGVPIGSFQAVKHHLADAALQLTFARPAVIRAAWSLATDDPNRSRDVSMAKSMASRAVTVVGRKALQCHGAIGYTEEYDLQLFLKRSWALGRSWGDEAWHSGRVASRLGLERMA